MLPLWCEKEKKPLTNKKLTNYGKRNSSRRQKNKAYKLILKASINEDDENLLKEGLNLLALNPNLSSKQLQILERLFGYYWYKSCYIKIIKQDE